MALITADMNMEELDDWFKIGQDASTKKRPELVASSALRGHAFDHRTGGILQKDRQKEIDSKLPKYRRGNRIPERQQYVDEYRQQEQEELLSQAAISVGGRDSPTSVVTSNLEGLELDSTAIGGSVAVPDDLIPEGATDVYKNYKFRHNYVELPVLEARETIVSTIESNQVTVIQGPTGSGKTTQVPQFILDHYAEESRYCNIVVTQPRKIAALSISRRVCDERGWELGSVCGYQIGLDRTASDDTRILYCTTGILKEKLICKKDMHEFTHVILDEVHERDIESDFALLIVKKLLRTNSRHVKVVLMSATFDTQVFAQYFALPVGNRLEPAPVITVGTLHHHVSEFFADDLTSRLGDVPPIDELQPGIHPGMYDMAIGLIKEFDLLEEKEQGKDPHTAFAPIRGTVLVFLPGLQEISQMCNRLRPLEDTHFILPIPLHSTITLDEQSKVFRKPSRGFRKVIISTNIAESSITVPDIKYVIDFGLTKNLCCDPDTNYTQLQLEWASKANCKQRKGRAGRVSNGRVYYMMPGWFYEKVLPEYGVPEMQRSPLESLILKTKIFDMGEPKAILALALSPPNLEDIERTILSLKEVGALSSSVGTSANPYDGNLTFIGRVLAGLPVDIRVGKLLVLGHVFGMLDECLIIGAAMSVKSIFANPMHSRVEAYKAKLSWSDHSLSDCIAILNAYKVWEQRVKMKEFERSGASEKQWGMKSFLQVKTLKEVHKLVEELEQRLAHFNILRPQREPHFKKAHNNATERLLLKLVLCGAFYPNYAVKEDTDELEAVKLLSSNDPRRTVMVKGMPMNQGILYEKQLRETFSICSKDPPPVISCEQSRAFITFPWKPGQESSNGIHPGVYVAIKIRQSGIRLSLDMYDKEETTKRLAELQRTTSGLRTTNDLRTQRLQAEGVEGDGLQTSRMVTIDPHISTLLINVTEVIDCGHFFAQCDDVKSGQLLSQIQSILNNPASNLQPFMHSVQPGMLVAAPYQDPVEHYYRARVDEIVTEKVPVAGGNIKSIMNAIVFFVDYGNTEKIHIDRLRVLPFGCERHPFLAVEFYLKGIRPSNLRCPDGVWSRQAQTIFRTMTLNKSLYAQVYSIVNNIVRVELVAKYPQGQELCLNDELVEQGFADKAEESVLSQQNHAYREALKQGERSTRSDFLQVSVPMGETEDNKQAVTALGRRRIRKIYLTGPINPLEMAFTNITLSGRQRVVKVDPDSVNCVAIDDDPQNKFSRLMVSSFIGLNSAGNSMVARETTILPQIPNLPALVTLLFAPYAEYRVDPKFESYTGALCGLGFDEDKLPILPDHDIEVCFETKFETSDIEMINEVRMVINIAVGTEENVAVWSTDVFSKIQETAREKLLALFKKPRERIEPRSYNKLYEWNQIDPSMVLPHHMSDTEADSHHLLQLHNAITLIENEDHLLSQGGGAVSAMEYLLDHQQYLEGVVESHARVPVYCELCRSTVLNSQILAIHMQTERHLHNLTLVREGKFPK